MLVVKHTCGKFEHDIYELIRAFYPGKEVDITSKEEQNTKEKSIELYDEKEQLICRISIPEMKTKESRLDEKNQLKQTIYEALHQVTKKELPWGTLTGIRPVKIVTSMLEQGKTEEKIKEHLHQTYFMSEEKQKLCMQVGSREREILSRIDYKNGYSLYIGIPFCPTTCLYCSFTSYPLAVWKSKTDEYVETLCKEIQAMAQLMERKSPQTIYMGGGTPTTLEPDQLERIFLCLEQSFPNGGIAELTVEAGRPDSITKEKLQMLKKHKVSRISINPQTMNDKTLELIGRNHTTKQIQEAYVLARELGFDNINMDLIVGLPGETYSYVEHTMKEIEKLDPDSITVHSLAIKRAARLNLFKEKYDEYGMHNTPELMELTKQYAKKMGMSPYYLYRQKNMAGNFENVGYAKVDKAGIYNILIMEEKQTILSVGAGGSTKIVLPGNRIERVENVKDAGVYIERIDEMIERKRKAEEEYGFK